MGIDIELFIYSLNNINTQRSIHAGRDWHSFRIYTWYLLSNVIDDCKLNVVRYAKKYSNRALFSVS